MQLSRPIQVGCQDWVQYAGGPNAHLPGSQASATVNLTEGDYVLMCWIPDKNGVPHVALGMQKALFVRGGKPTMVSGAKASNHHHAN